MGAEVIAVELRAAREALFSKDESLGYCEREGAIHAFLGGDAPACRAERYVSALEWVLGRLSTPIERGDLLLGRMVEGPVPYEMESVPAGGVSHKDNPFRCYQRNQGHLSLDYAPLLQKGLDGIVSDMEAAAATEPQKRYAALARRAAEAIRAFALRYAQAAQQHGMHRAAKALAAVPYAPAYDFFSAAQGIWLFEMILSCVTGGRDFAYSRLSLALLPFFREGEERDVLDILTAFIIKNNEIGGMGSELDRHMPVPCAATNIYLMLGGRGAEDALALDLLFLRAATAVKLPQPVLALRVSADSPDRWKRACARAAQDLYGQAALYNDDALIPSLRALGLSERQALHYTMSGCNRAEFSGHQSSDVFHSCPAWLLSAFFDPAVRDMDGLLVALRREARAALGQVRGNPRVPQREGLHFSLESLLLAGCADNVCDIENGGLSAETVVHNLCGIATVADSLAAIHRLVFCDGALTLSEYRAAVQDGFAQHPALRARIARQPKYGNDHPDADRWARLAGEIFADEVRALCGERIHIPSFYSLYMHHRMGERLGATPDGRLAGQPISENQSPVYGADTEGITALLRSAASLPQHLCGAGGLNIRLARRMEDSLLLGLVEAYFEMGGVNVAVNVVSRETLLAARADPEQYKSLCVRVVGYSEVFLNLSEQVQRELIERTEAAV